MVRYGTHSTTLPHLPSTPLKLLTESDGIYETGELYDYAFPNSNCRKFLQWQRDAFRRLSDEIQKAVRTDGFRLDGLYMTLDERPFDGWIGVRKYMHVSTSPFVRPGRAADFFRFSYKSRTSD